MKYKMEKMSENLLITTNINLMDMCHFWQKLRSVTHA